MGVQSATTHISALHVLGEMYSQTNHDLIMNHDIFYRIEFGNMLPQTSRLFGIHYTW
jgi:hypothetical protein